MVSTGAGKPAGAWKPYQLAASKSLTPTSSKVGISGAPAVRWRVDTPSARSLPALNCGTTLGIVENVDWICPAITSATAGPVPLYGTCVKLIPVRSLKSSPTSWVIAPPEPSASLPGCALASSMNCGSVCAGTDGCTTSASGDDAASAIGVKSRLGSYGTFLNIPGLIVCGVSVTS